MLAKKRLLQEVRQWEVSEEVDLQARPTDESSMLHWMFVFRGPEGTDYESGVYVGTVDLPANYPMSPPTLKMLTPSGRLQVNMALCLSFTSYHPESWNPAWTIQSMLRGLVSFMADTEEHEMIGGLHTSAVEKKRFAQESCDFNKSIPQFLDLFPDFQVEIPTTRAGKRQRVTV